MQDINNYIKENDTDNVTINKLKELGTKLTGVEVVEGETIAEVLDFINSNYSGGGSVSKKVLYVSETDTYLYKDEDLTTKINATELYDYYINGFIIYLGYNSYTIPIACSKITTGSKTFTGISLLNKEGAVDFLYSSEYTT